jgi:hypothetical protein
MEKNGKHEGTHIFFLRDLLNKEKEKHQIQFFKNRNEKVH